MSADYDIVTTFFVDLTMFLKRMKILEKRLPEEGAFHDCVYDVFGSLLKMCGIATKYIELKRFSKLFRRNAKYSVEPKCMSYSPLRREMGDQSIQRRRPGAR